MNLILLDFISGMSVGIEFFTGEDLEPVVRTPPGSG